MLLSTSLGTTTGTGALDTTIILHTGALDGACLTTIRAGVFLITDILGMDTITITIILITMIITIITTIIMVITTMLTITTGSTVTTTASTTESMAPMAIALIAT